MSYLKTKQEKSILLDEFKTNVQKIYEHYIKVCRKKSSTFSNKRVQILEIKEQFPDYDIENILCFDICYLYELDYKFVSFSFDFPKKFNSYSDLKDNVYIHISLFSQHDCDFKSTIIDFNNFEKICNDYLYISEKIEEYNVFGYIQASLTGMTESLFVDTVMRGNNKELSLIVENIKKNNEVFCDALKSKNKYLEKRRETNKARKEHKKQNKSFSNNEISNNNFKIKKLEREIENLKKANKALESNSKGEHITQNASSELALLMKEYEKNINTFGRTCIKKTNTLSSLRRTIFSTFLSI
jgi:hypothetical protein